MSITAITFSHDFSHAIEQKQVEEQNVQRAEFVRQQAEKEGQRQLALAEGQAKANRLLQESLKSSPEVLQMKALDKWDGTLPAYMGSGSVPFIKLGGSVPFIKLDQGEIKHMIKLIVGAGEVLVFLLIVAACGYLVYLGIRLWDKDRTRRMVQRVMKSKDPKEHL